MKMKRIILETSQMHDLTIFYHQLLKIPVEHPREEEIHFGIGSTQLVFRQAGAADPFYHFAFNIPANKIEEARDWIGARVNLIRMEEYNGVIADFQSWHAQSLYFFDPAGNIVELIARFDLPNEREEPFTPVQFLNVSEMGLVFREEDLNEATEALIRDYELDYFDKQKPLPHFRALGADEGLFIVVPDQRNWYPTQKPSGIFHLEILFEQKGKEYELKMQGLQ